MCDFYIFLERERERERERRGCGSGRRDMKKQEVCFSTLSSLTHEEIQKETLYHGVFRQSPFQAKSVHSAATFVIPPKRVPTRLLILHLKIYTFSEFLFLLLSLLRKSVYYFPGNRTHNLCAAKAMLYHWATGTRMLSLLHYNTEFWFQWIGLRWILALSVALYFCFKKGFHRNVVYYNIICTEKNIICTCDHTVMIG